ncbi:disulfide bond formation protein B [Roseococcus sp. SYP-B2431]|uniref:disulfide bond formation protein B n=1 Tax=Roseococcus sp. SYP-B2431 TaxID=2496640 RepID=UPI00103A511A|nr:disulfide bond formation protein B [Roseococcus sp. SYP-B2431]TCI00253.1 disulfide bond formation protein B [Roseococcus sp. SYP-B2431]
MHGSLLVLALSLAAPLFAKGSEGWFSLAPCELCLWQRWPYWAAAGLAALSLFVARRSLLCLAGLAAAASAAVAAFHLGVEWGWWPSPLAGCQVPTAGASLSVEDMLRSLAPAPSKPCDLPAFLIPGLPLSMAGMNLFYGLFVAILAWRIARKEPRA